MNPLCQCPAAGFCPRHKMMKTEGDHRLCKGVAHGTDCGRKFWIAWERGQLGATAPPDPITDPPQFCQHRGLGDTVAQAISFVTGGLVQPCGGCQDRQAQLNQMRAATPAIVGPTDLTDATRHLMFHVWPVAGPGTWQWNCDRLIENEALFNGRRLIGIAVDQASDTAETVMEYLGSRGFEAEYIVAQNVPNLGEVTTFVPCLEKLETYFGPGDVTFRAHAKCVRHRIALEDAGATIFRWTNAMWDANCHWESVRPILEQHATAGIFRRKMQRIGRSWGPWHYSGSFYWFRNRESFARNWRYVPNAYYGTEAWPGLLFPAINESGLIFGDNVGDLYTLPYWESEIEPAISAWKASHA